MRGFTLLGTTTALALLIAGMALGTSGGPAQSPVTPLRSTTDTLASPQHAAAGYADIPVSFTENRGQTDARVRYFAQGSGYSFFMTPSEVVLSLSRDTSGTPASQGLALALQFVGGNPNVQPQGVDRAAGTVNDLRGDDPDAWHTGIAQYRDVVYPDLWPKIDMRVHEQSGVLKYEFDVHPGASAADIRLAYRGGDGLTLGTSGGLQIATPLGTLQDSVPVSYQRVGGVRVPVASRYVLDDSAAASGRFSFAVGDYSHDRDLVIDPGVQYTTFLGGASAETGVGIAVDAAGSTYVAGTTQSPDFPTTTGAFDRTGAPQNFADIFVSKLNPAGTALVYSTFVGGSDMEFAQGMTLDASGNVYVTGQTKSTNFPTTGGALDRSLNIPPNCPRCVVDNTDNFVFKLNAAGSALAYSTYLGGTDYDAARGITIDGSGNAYVSGETLSRDYPTTAGAFDRTLAGDYDMFVTKLNTTGSALVYSTFIGGTAVDNGGRVKVDSGGNAYVLGFSSSTDFPTTAGAYDTTADGGFDGTLTKLNPAGSALVYSTLFGGSDFDSGGGLVIDSAGSAYVAGSTSSPDFPTTTGAYDRTFAGGDAFVAKFNTSGSGLVFSTLVGGSSSDSFSGLALDTAGNAWLTGGTSSADFPVTAGAPDTTFNGGGDATITELNASGSALLFSTFLGGSNSEGGADITRDAVGDLYITGSTFSQDFPATVGAFDRVWNGDLQVFWGDAFISKLDIDATTSTPPAPPAVPAAPVLVSPANASSQPQPITFDWNDAASAVTYTIQIDDSSAFSAPLMRDVSVTTSMYATTGLGTGIHFWRVRGVNSAGVAGPWSAVRTVTPQAAPPPSQLSTIDLNPASVVGGSASSGTVVMTTAVPDGALILLSSSNPAVASVPATTTATGFTGTFVVSTTAVVATTSVSITAAYNGVTRTAVLTLTPAASVPVLQTLSVNPSTVTGGSNTSAVVTLSAAAPPGGAFVSLFSSASAVASVPAGVTVAAGATAAGFTVATSAVGASTAVTLTATYNGVSRTATATVAAATPPPSQNVTLTVSATGRSGERVVSTPTGISVLVGSTAAAPFPSGTAITLRISSGRDAVWSGACSSGGQKVKSCTFTTGADAAVNVDVK